MADDALYDLLRERLNPDRYTHSLNVADSAKALALRFGADADKAYTAGLLHDVMKNAPAEEQFQLFREAGVTLTPLEAANKKLWHAMGAPLFLRLKLGIEDEEILNAVRYHTTGRAGMSLMEKIVFTADYISAERQYNGVDVMRALAEKSLEDAMLYALQFTLTKLSAQRRCIHPDCLACYNDIIMSKQ